MGSLQSGLRDDKDGTGGSVDRKKGTNKKGAGIRAPVPEETSRDGVGRRRGSGGAPGMDLPEGQWWC